MLVARVQSVARHFVPHQSTSVPHTRTTQTVEALPCMRMVQEDTSREQQWCLPSQGKAHMIQSHARFPQWRAGICRLPVVAE